MAVGAPREAAEADAEGIEHYVSERELQAFEAFSASAARANRLPKFSTSAGEAGASAEGKRVDQPSCVYCEPKNNPKMPPALEACIAGVHRNAEAKGSHVPRRPSECRDRLF